MILFSLCARYQAKSLQSVRLNLYSVMLAFKEQRFNFFLERARASQIEELVALAHLHSDNEKRILLSSKEMAKASISYNLGKANLAHRDLLSAGVNFYYSLFHSCLSVISSTSNAIPVDQCVAEFKKQHQLPRYYVPLNHSAVVKLVKQLDQKLADELDRLMKIREYLSYGPNILYEEERGKVRIDVYTKKFTGLRSEIRKLRHSLPDMICRCCELLRNRLDNVDFSRFLLYFYISTDAICKDLHIEQDLVKECFDILSSFDEGNTMRKFHSKIRIGQRKAKGK